MNAESYARRVRQLEALRRERWDLLARGRHPSGLRVIKLTRLIARLETKLYQGVLFER